MLVSGFNQPYICAIVIAVIVALLAIVNVVIVSEWEDFLFDRQRVE